MKAARHIILILALLISAPAFAQESNMALLALTDTTFTEVSLGVYGQAGDYRNIYDPETLAGGVLKAESRLRQDSVFLYGRFGYGYDYGTGSRWRGWVNPYQTPFMAADSVAGPVSLEKYSMEAGIAAPAGRFVFGAGAAYDVALMAKHRDLRNKNTLMEFRIAPGVLYRGRSIDLGLDLGYVRGTERVEYIQVVESVERYLFDVYGLWLAQSTGFSSAEKRRMKESDTFFGDFRVRLRMGSLLLDNNFHAGYEVTRQGEVGYNNLLFGDTRSLAYTDNLDLRFGRGHCISASYSVSTMQGFRYLQRQELDEASSVRSWVTYGDPVHCYYRSLSREDLSYTLSRRMKFTAGLSALQFYHTYTEYPLVLLQSFTELKPYLRFVIPAGRSLTVSPDLWVSHIGKHDTIMNNLQLYAPMKEEWDYWVSDSLGGRLQLEWRPGRMFLRLAYGLDCRMKFDAFRHDVGATLGFVF